MLPVARGVPFVVADSTSWCARWTLSQLEERYGQLSIRAEETRNVYVGERRIRETTLTQFIAAIRSGDRSLRYKGDLVSRAPLVGRDLRMGPPPLFASLPSARRDERTTLWLSPAGTTSSLHHDGDVDNLNLQIEGQKTFVLIPPHERSRLSCWGSAESPLDPFAPDFVRFPEYADVRPLVVTLSPGEALFVPRYWYHCVRTEAPSVNLSVHFGWRGEPSPFAALRGTPIVHRVLTTVSATLKRRGHVRTARVARRVWLSLYRRCVPRSEPQRRQI